MRSFLQKLLSYKELASIQIDLGTNQILYVLLKKEKNSLAISDQTRLESITQLGQKHQKNTPFIVNLHGKGIVYHQNLKSENISFEDILQDRLPGADPNDFAIQGAGPSSKWYSIVRKSVLEKILEELENQRMQPIQVYLGIHAIQPFIFLFQEADEVQLLNHTISWQENDLIQIASNNLLKEETITLGDEQISSSILLPFITALRLISETPLDTYPSIAAVDRVKAYWDRKILHYSLLSGLGVLFVALLVNFLLFNQYQRQMNSLSNELSFYQLENNKLDSLYNELEDKTRWLAAQPSIGQSRTAFFADRLAQQLPSSIELQELNIYPLQKKRNRGLSEEIIGVDYSSILIKGKTKSTSDLNNWISVLQTEPWITSVKLLPFKSNSEGNAQFELEISLKP